MKYRGWENRIRESVAKKDGQGDLRNKLESAIASIEQGGLNTGPRQKILLEKSSGKIGAAFFGMLGRETVENGGEGGRSNRKGDSDFGGGPFRVLARYKRKLIKST